MIGVNLNTAEQNCNLMMMMIGEPKSKAHFSAIKKFTKVCKDKKDCFNKTPGYQAESLPPETIGDTLALIPPPIKIKIIIMGKI